MRTVGTYCSSKGFSVKSLSGFYGDVRRVFSSGRSRVALYARRQRGNLRTREIFVVVSERNGGIVPLA